MVFRFYSRPSEANRVSVVGQHSEGVLKIAVARCGQKDNFIRAVGRNLAEKRLEEGKVFSTHDVDECNVKTFLKIAKTVAAGVASTKRIY